MSVLFCFYFWKLKICIRRRNLILVWRNINIRGESTLKAQISVKNNQFQICTALLYNSKWWYRCKVASSENILISMNENLEQESATLLSVLRPAVLSQKLPLIPVGIMNFARKTSDCTVSFFLYFLWQKENISFKRIFFQYTTIFIVTLTVEDFWILFFRIF